MSTSDSTAKHLKKLISQKKQLMDALISEKGISEHQSNVLNRSITLLEAEISKLRSEALSFQDKYISFLQSEVVGKEERMHQWKQEQTKIKQRLAKREEKKRLIEQRKIDALRKNGIMDYVMIAIGVILPIAIIAGIAYMGMAQWYDRWDFWNLETWW